MRLRRDHHLGLSEAKRRVEELAAALALRHELSSTWYGGDLHVVATALTGRIMITEEAVHVDIRLGLPLVMFRAAIRSEVESGLDRHFG